MNDIFCFFQELLGTSHTLYEPQVRTRLKCYMDVFSLYRKMGFLGIQPDLYTLSILMNCCCHMRNVDSGFGVFGGILKRGFKVDSVTVPKLVKGLCAEGKVLDAVHVFDKYLKKVFKGMCSHMVF